MLLQTFTRVVLAFSLFFSCQTFLNGQVRFGHRPHPGHVDHCGTVEMEEALQEKYPQLKSDERFERWLAPLVRRYQSSAQKRAVVTLPVIFHIIHNGEPVGTGDNLAANFIYSQIDQINNDFRRAPGTSGFNDNPVGADTEISFCAASFDESGVPLAEIGINRVDATQQGWTPPYLSSFTNDVIKPATQFDPDNYVNIWVLPLESSTPGFSLLGYAQFPDVSGLPGLPTLGGLANTDGVAVNTFTVGSTENPNPTSPSSRFGRGRTLTHELGHFFGLRHIWGDGGCLTDDFCADTPDANIESTGCDVGKTTCGSLDMIENYMDYTDDVCMNIFTQDQNARMQAVLANSPRRNTLANSTACAPAGLNADFEASFTVVEVGNSLTFTDKSTGNPTSWSWTFEGGTPGTSTDQNPVVTYNIPGTYDVTLTISNAGDSQTKILTDYIIVQAGPLCTSVVSSFPYQESFESNLGLWTQESGEGIDWTRDSGGTPSTNTGPPSGADGSFYLYTEASNGNTNQTAILNSPCFDFTNAVSADFDFQYHMFGNGIGTLSLQVSQDAGNNWTTIWSLSGDQGNQWVAERVNLNSYVGNPITTFRFVGLTGDNFRSDIAIDDIEVSVTGGGGNNGNAPVADFSADQTSINVGQTVNFTDLSTESPTSWAWTFTGGTPGSSTDQNPSVTYNSAGIYAVSLTATNVDGSDTETKTNFITVTDIPTTPNCTADVSAFPYNESFEANLGLWTQASNDDFNWTRDSGGTPSSQTGPSSGKDGNFYLYTEASGGNTNNTSVLNSPCFDLSGKSTASFNFSYHMFGSDMGSLTLEASTDDGSNWTTLWVRSGDQGNQWLDQSLNLSSYLGGNVRFRFIGVTGNSFRSDMAIDAISITTSGGGTPPTAEFTADRTNIMVGEIVNFTDLSTNNPTSWSWTFNGGSPSSSSLQNPTVTYNAAGSYSVTLTATNNEGSDTETKIAYITVIEDIGGGNSCVGDVMIYPYSESFEGNLGQWVQETNDDFNWTRNSGGTPSSQTGPLSAVAGNFYLYTEASGGNTNNTSILNSPCFDLSGASTATFEFAYHMFGSNMGTLSLEASNDDGNNWNTLWTLSGNQGNQWVQESVDLSVYAGGTVQLRFIGLTGNGFRSDMAIDAIGLTTSGGGSAPVADFSANQTNITTGQSVNFTDLSSGNPTSWLWTFAGGSPGNSSTQNPVVTYNTTGIYEVTLTATNTVGSDTETKVGYITVTDLPSSNGCSNGINSYPYVESFESNLGLWSQSNGDDIDWSRDSGGTPSSFTGPSSGSQGNFYLYTEASGGNSNVTAILTSPCFNLTGGSGLELVYDYHMYGSNMGTLSLEISVDDGNNWSTLWSLSGDQGNQWFTNSIDLSAYANETGVLFRFIGLTGNGFRSDLAIDNIRVQSATTREIGNIGVEAAAINFDYILAPNPTYGNMDIIYNSANPITAVVTVSDLLGRELSSQKVIFEKGENRTTLDLNNLEAGTYLILIRTDKLYKAKRFVKID